MKTKIISLLLFGCICCGTFVNAQTEPKKEGSHVKTKIIIVNDGEKTVIEESIDGHNVKTYKCRIPKDCCVDKDKCEHKFVSKKVFIDDESGEKKMTIVTVKDGNEEVIELEGDEVDEYLKKHPDVFSGKEGKGQMMVIATTSDEAGEEAEIDINIDIDKILEEAGIKIEKGEGGKKIIIKSSAKADSEGGAYAYSYSYSLDGLENLGEEIEKMLEDIEIEVEKSEDMEDLGEGGKRVVIKTSASQTKSVIVKKRVRIEDLDDTKKKEKPEYALKLEKIDFYPNPNDGNFTLEFTPETDSPTEITITDIDGKLIYKYILQGKGPFSQQIDISYQSKGIYILNLQQGKKSMSKKLVVE